MGEIHERKGKGRRRAKLNHRKVGKIKEGSFEDKGEVTNYAVGPT
jgi:hypothetical protein